MLRACHNSAMLFIAILGSLLLCLHASAKTVYVSTNSTPLSPYTNWATAANDIYDAVQVVEDGDSVLVTNGVYTITIGVWVTNDITIRSVGGAESTIIRGNPTGGCPFYLSHTNAVIQGLTIADSLSNTKAGGVWCDGGGTVRNCIVSGNETLGRGGGIYCENGGIVDNCLIISNRIAGTGTSRRGGGIFIENSGTVRNSIIRDNYAYWNGGGICNYEGTIENCLIIHNSSKDRGGGIWTYWGNILNCTICDNTSSNDAGGGIYTSGVKTSFVANTILYYNTAATDNNYSGSTVFSNCCTLPHPGSPDNITNPPAFVGRLSNNYHLLLGSPCIDTGTNLLNIITDLNGVPRPLDGNDDSIIAWDIGAYEFVHTSADTDADQMPDGWEISNSLNPLSDDASGDADTDNSQNLDEYIAGTDPGNSNSIFKIIMHSGHDANDFGSLVQAVTSNAEVKIMWLGGTNGVTNAYQIYRATNLLDGVWTPITNYPRTNASGTNVWIDLNASNCWPNIFYKITAPTN
ncbi:choice-of-anchor Q domain-containing protein [Verrucomicrobiota bacterium]